MSKEMQRALQWVIFVILFFCGPVGWVCIYLLWERWNPKSATKNKSRKN